MNIMQENDFKRGDFVVSGHGNTGIFLCDTYEENEFLRLTADGTHERTDKRYARMATEDEKRDFVINAKYLGFSEEDAKLFFSVSGYKGKRWRPSVVVYRALEKKYNDLVIELAEKNKELEALRETLREAKFSKHNEVHLEATIDDIRKNRQKLELSNKYLQERLSMAESHNSKMRSDVEHLEADIELLCNRNLFERIFRRYEKECRIKKG